MSLEKIRKMTVNELYVRLAQKSSVLSERLGWSAGAELPSDEELFAKLRPFTGPEEFLDHLNSRRRPRFFESMVDRVRTTAAFQRKFPEAVGEIRTQADEILKGRFNLLGLSGVSFGEPVNWHVEPLSDKETPLVHWSLIDYLNPNLAGDKKLQWELNRHQYFATLGQAYWLSLDERYAQGFVEHLGSWMDHNPPKLGINWASSLEIAFRSISWIWAVNFFKTSLLFSPDILNRLLKFLYVSARHLETYLSTYFSPNTHLTGEALGLFYLGTMFPEFEDAERWKSTGRQILLEQITKQIRADGGYFEQSSYYHRYTADFYSHFHILAGLNNLPDCEVTNELSLLLEHLMYLTRPDGTTPLFGDDDGGRLMRLDRKPANDFRPTLSTGAVLLLRPDLRFVAGELAEETFWLLGADCTELFDSITPDKPKKLSVAFPESGYFVLRDAWTRDANFLLFDSGVHGSLSCGHAHADALAVEVAVKGFPLLVDPGTFTYTGSKEFRDWFRSTMAHNTVTVDRESSSLPNGPFSWLTQANADVTAWISEGRFDYIVGEHDGYQRLRAPVKHKRSILFLKDDYWIIRDSLISEGYHHYELWFHFAEHIQTQLDARNRTLISTLPDQSVARIVVLSDGGKWSTESGWTSSCYGTKKNAPVFAHTADGSAVDFITLIFPQRRAEQSVVELEAEGGRAFQVVSSNAVDTVIIRTEREVRTHEVRSDFTFGWIRLLQNGDAVPVEFLLIDGHSLTAKDKQLFKSATAIDYAIGGRFESEFHGRMNGGVLNMTARDWDSSFKFSGSGT